MMPGTRYCLRLAVAGTFTALLMVACNGGAGNENIQAAGTPKGTEEQSADTTPGNLARFAEMVPLTLLETESDDPYEKYGIDRGGHCYSCNLAVLHINKKHFDVTNVCDAADFFRIESFTYTVDAQRLTLKAGKLFFAFDKLGTAPVYVLEFAGDSAMLRNKRLSEYYTPKAELPKFKVHDCGDFDG